MGTPTVEQSLVLLNARIKVLNERILELLDILQGLGEIFDARGKGNRIKGLYVKEGKLNVDYDDET